MNWGELIVGLHKVVGDAIIPLLVGLSLLALIGLAIWGLTVALIRATKGQSKVSDEAVSALASIKVSLERVPERIDHSDQRSQESFRQLSQQIAAIGVSITQEIQRLGADSNRALQEVRQEARNDASRLLDEVRRGLGALVDVIARALSFRERERGSGDR